MTTFTHTRAAAGALLCLAWLVAPAGAAITNAVGWSESFEPYPVGTLLQGTNGWSSDRTGAGIVTNAPASANPLASTNIAAVTDLLSNEVHSASGSVVVLDLLALPTGCDIDPPGNTNQQYALYVKTNQHLVVWQHSPGPSPTNAWLELASGPQVNTGAWTRFTFVANYSNRLFQVRINGGAPVADPAGYAADGVTPNGPWFHMVQTHDAMARVILGDRGTNYVDDLTVTNRILSWAPSGFTESVTNDGAIDHAVPVVATLSYDAFTGTNGADLTPYVVVESGLPAGLSLAARRTGETTAALTLDGAAAAHAASNSVTNLAVRFTSGAFVLGNAADVTGSRQAGLGVTFRDTAVLAWSTNTFHESNPANDGSISNTPPLTIALANDVFSGGPGEDYATNAAKVLVAGLPAGLTGQVVKLDDTHLQVALLGHAAAHTHANGTAFTLTLLGPAFATNTVTGTVSNNTATLAIEYVDAPSLTYASTTFAERPANNGSVTGTTVALLYDTFTGTNGADLADAGFVVAPGLPAGLTLQAIRTSPTLVTLAFLDKATSHAAADSRLNDLTINFLDGAFGWGHAANVSGAARSDLSMVFQDPPALSTPGGTVFTEAPLNNGSIGNALVITLNGDTFAAALGGTYTVTQVPDGLVPQLTRDSDTQVTLSFTGQAAAHTAAQSTNGLTLAFADAAFSTVAAANIAGSTLHFAVTFADPPALAYSRTSFAELSFGTIDNRTPMTITLSGDTFAAAPDGDFSAWVTVANLPQGLSAVFTRSSDTQLAVTLTGAATAQAASNTIHNLGFTFRQGAFAQADAAAVTGYSRSDLGIVFGDDTAFVNTVPYQESFEDYPNGFLLAGTNAWTADFYPDSAQVTNRADLAALLAAWPARGKFYPMATNHTQVLLVRDSIRNEVHSSSGQKVYLDFMMVPVAMQEAPLGDTNHQFAFYINTNRQVVIWHRNTTGVPANEWRVLTNNAPLIDTNAWTRFTVAQDYSNRMFQLRINEGLPLVDAAGWDAAGLVRTGSWFHMVNTNADAMNRLRVIGAGTAYVDDVTVVTTLPPTFGMGIGSVFKFR